MSNAACSADRFCGPTIFSHDSDEQVITWLRHAQSMLSIEGRWQAAWHLFASEATQECVRRKLQVENAQAFSQLAAQ